MAHVLRTVLSATVVHDRMFPNPSHKEALTKCFKEGWLHADKNVSHDAMVVGYFFASPLHRWFVTCKLLDQIGASPVITVSLLEFVIQVIRCFSPLNLSSQRIVGPYYFQSVPEAQYQDEFYRCCYDLTAGCLVTFPEFGTAEGRVDFYIPSKRWGVELLRDGQLLDQHSGRFSPTGSYGATLDIDKYIILDFRKKRVMRSHPRTTISLHSMFYTDFLFPPTQILKAYFTLYSAKTIIQCLF